MGRELSWFHVLLCRGLDQDNFICCLDIFSLVRDRKHHLIERLKLINLKCSISNTNIA